MNKREIVGHGRGFYEINKGKKLSKTSVSGVGTIGKRKEYRYNRGNYSIYYYLLMYQLTAAEVT